MNNIQITILTATYNRAHLLPDLYQSLCRQTCKDFIWVVVDDGSKDGTSDLVRGWMTPDNGFHIDLYTQPNAGKDRAVNNGVSHITTPYTMIMDSDDYLTDDAVAFLLKALAGISGLKALAGISGLKALAGISGFRGESEVKALNRMEGEWVDASNLERKALGIDRDCCEVYRTDLLRSHPFKVWEGEKFTPEEVVWNQLALEGYKLRWFNKVTCIVRYQEGGLTLDSWGLFKKNPMGYAMMFNHRLLYSHSIGERINNILQFICCCYVGGNLSYISHSNNKLLTYLLLPLGIALGVRRKRQIQ